MLTQIVLFGAGGLGRKALAHLQARGITPVAFADCDKSKQGTEIEGIPVMRPGMAEYRFPDACWVPTVLSLPASQEVPELLQRMPVRTLPLWTCLNGEYHVDRNGFAEVMELVADDISRRVAQDQFDFYSAPDYEVPSPHESMKDIYFPDFISRLNNECFVDCGAADGDSVAQFLERWAQYDDVLAVEPDLVNFEKLRLKHPKNVSTINAAVGDWTGEVPFLSTGNYCSRIGTEGLPGAVQCRVQCYRLDDLLSDASFIKMDIEGEELKAIDGAQDTIQRHKPVLAICGYHTPDHFWQVPKLIHEIEPSYKLFLRRYAPASFELICYAVPEERLVV